MWYQKAYVNRRDWILENLPVLKLSSTQAMVVLMIDYLNFQQSPVSIDILAKRLGMDVKDVDEAVFVLTSRKALKVRVERDTVVFSLDGLFENNLYEFVDESIFNVFETEFSRPLSQHEFTTLNEFLAKYSQSEILNALRAASIQRKLTMPYIHSILVNNRKDTNGSL